MGDNHWNAVWWSEDNMVHENPQNCYSTCSSGNTEVFYNQLQSMQTFDLQYFHDSESPLYGELNQPIKQEHSTQVNAQKIQMTKNVINLMERHKEALENGQNQFDMKPLLESLRFFSHSHNCLDLLHSFKDGETSNFDESFQVVFIEGIPISKKVWAKAESQPDPKKIANSLLEDLYSPEELLNFTLKSRKLKSGCMSEALDPIRINVIYKVVAWMIDNRGRGNSFACYNPNDPNRPLTATEMSIVREALGQKRNNCNQKKVRQRAVKRSFKEG